MARKLVYVWAGLDFLHFASGVVAIVAPIILMMMSNDDPLLRLIFTDREQNFAFAVAGLVLATWLISLWGFLSAMKAKNGTKSIFALEIFNWSLVVCACVLSGIGLAVWFFTLNVRTEFGEIWEGLSQTDQQSLQDDLECCGYFNATTAGLFQATSGFCSKVASNDNETEIFGCAAQITDSADFDLNNLFSTIFGFIVIEAALFLFTVAVIKWRHEEERFKKIDSKRYGTV